jgi:hypothetical protein
VIRGIVTAVVLSALVVGCGGTAPSAPQVVTVTAQPPAPVDQSVAADRAVCIDFDARGGTLYNVLVVPMMERASGPKSISVNPGQLARAASSVEEVGRGTIDEASPAIADAAQRLVASAGSLGVYEHADSTALLTSFVTLAVECQKAGHKPSWFDAESLAQH